MSARINDPQLQRAYDTLRQSGARGAELAAVLDRHRTRVRVSRALAGGFTLNLINTVFLQPLAPHSSEHAYKQWVTLLAHEACHVEQRYWVDSVQQEMRAYQAQCMIARELGADLGFICSVFPNLDPDREEHRVQARAALVSLFVGQPAAIVYASLPLLQPTGVRAITAGARELAAVIRAGLSRRRT